MERVSEKMTRRHRVNESVIGKNAMEGLTLDTETLTLMRPFEQGELTRQELSLAIDTHVTELLAEQQNGHAKLIAAIQAA